ncbi:MAG: PqqD family protein [Candidatus Omnitrophota bacterium]
MEKNSFVVYRKIRGECILVATHRKHLSDGVFSLEEVGGRIWELLNGKRSNLCIAQKLASEFGISASLAQKDTLSFLEQLKKEELVRLKGR